MLFQCQDAPKVDGIATDNALALYVAQLHGAYLDCKGRLANLQKVTGGGR